MGHVTSRFTPFKDPKSTARLRVLRVALRGCHPSIPSTRKKVGTGDFGFDTNLFGIPYRHLKTLTNVKHYAMPAVDVWSLIEHQYAP